MLHIEILMKYYAIYWQMLCIECIATVQYTQFGTNALQKILPNAKVLHRLHTSIYWNNNVHWNNAQIPVPPDYRTTCSQALTPETIKSNQIIFSCVRKNDYCLRRLYNLYSEQHSLSVDPRFKGRKTPYGKKTKPFNRKKMMQPREEPHGQTSAIKKGLFDIHLYNFFCEQHKWTFSEQTSALNKSFIKPYSQTFCWIIN